MGWIDYTPIAPFKQLKNYFYDGPARQQKQGLDDYTSGMRDLGDWTLGEYDTRGNRAINRFDRAGGFLDRYASNEPKYVRDFYDNTRSKFANQPTGASTLWYGAQGKIGPNQVRNAYTNRLAYGYGADPVTDRYNVRRYAPPSQLESKTGEFESFSRMDPYKNRISDLTNRYAGNNVLDLRLGERGSYVPGTETKGFLSTFDPTAYSGRSDRLLGGQSQTRQLLDDIRGGGGQTGKFLQTFNPNSTKGLGETYKALKDEGPTYEEEFYTSQLNGDNPAYAFLRDQTERDARRGAAARGGFVSGLAMQAERDADTRLAAQEFARRGDLASMAGEARRARLGQRLQGAQALDSQILEGKRLKGQLGLSMDQLAGDLAGNEDRYLADLAKFGDTQGLEATKFKGGLVQSLDELGIRNQEDLDKISEAAARLGLDEDKVLNDLLNSSTSDARDRMKLFGDVLTNAGNIQNTREGQIDDLAGKSSDSIFNRGKAIDDLAGKASSEEQAWLDYVRGLGKDFDASNIERDRFLLDTAKGASDEQSGYLRDLTTLGTNLGKAEADTQQTYDTAGLDAKSKAYIQALDAQLQKAGIDAATRKAMLNDIVTAIKEGGKAYASGGAA